MDGLFDDLATAKRTMRAEMRVVRRSLPDRAERSARMWTVVRDLPAVRSATTVFVYASLPDEPDTAGLIEWCTAAGKQVLVPEATPGAPVPADLASVDVAIVPGTAFTATGDRLGQGGGWYDRVLTRLRPDALTIGVCFAPQLVGALPLEPHDVALDLVVTDDGVAVPAT